MCKSTKCQSKCKVPCSPNVQVIDPDVATFYKLMEDPENRGLYIQDPSQPVSVLVKPFSDEEKQALRENHMTCDDDLDAEIADLVQKVNALPEQVKPNYYKFNIKGTQCNMFDIARALGLSLELFSALKYFRVKGDTAKRINDLQKAKQCIDMEIENLSKSLKPNNHA